MIKVSKPEERTAPTIPTELYRLIVEQITQNRDLCSVARSSTTLQLEAERTLYKYISIEATPGVFHIIKSIIHHPHRHKLVQILDIYGWRLNNFGQSTFRRLVARLLRITTHLKALRVVHLPGWIIHHANHPLLKRLHLKPLLNYYGDPITQYDHPIIMEYLERHSSITNLTLDYQINQSIIGTSAFWEDRVSNIPFLPLLHTLELMGTSSHWIGGRHLKRFCLPLWGYKADIIRFISHLLTMGSNLVVLELSECAIQWEHLTENQNIEKIASSLPLLRFLGLPTSRDFSELGEDNMVRSIRNHLKMLTVFRLQTFGRNTLARHTIPDLLAIRPTLKWILFTAPSLPESMVLHTRESYPGRVWPQNNTEFQQVSLDLGIEVTGTGIRLTCFPAKVIH